MRHSSSGIKTSTKNYISIRHFTGLSLLTPRALLLRNKYRYQGLADLYPVNTRRVLRDSF
jgi:hypothetical protein